MRVALQYLEKAKICHRPFLSFCNYYNELFQRTSSPAGAPASSPADIYLLKSISEIYFSNNHCYTDN